MPFYDIIIMNIFKRFKVIFLKKLLFFVFLFLCVVSANAAYKNYTMYLYTYPNSLIADGKSSCDITAEVYDEDGNRVEDGLYVDFSTTLGNITPYDETSGGVATAILRSVPTEGTATVTATIPSYGVAARTTIDFLAPGTEIIKETFFAIDSDTYLGYDSESRIVDTVGGFTAKFKGVDFKGYEAQVDTLKNICIMKANMGEFFTAKKQKKELKISELYLDISKGKGYAYIYNEETEDKLNNVKLVSIRLSDLKCEDLEYLPDGINFDIKPIESSSAYATAKLFILDPKKEIKAKNAKIYVAGKKLIDMPWLRINIKDPNGIFGTPISVGTNGISMNMPLYYYLSKNGSGGVRVQRNQSSDGTFSSGNDMWRIDLEQEYGTGTDSTGTLKATTLNKQAGLRFNNTTRLPNQATFRGSIDYPSHQNLYSTLEFSQNLDNFYYSLQNKTYNYKNSDNRYYASGYISTQSQPLFKFLNWNVANQLCVDTGYEEKNSRVYNKTGIDVNTNTLRLGDFSLNANTSYYYKFQHIYNGDSIGFNINGNYQIGNVGNFGVHYSFLREKFDSIYNNRYISADFNIGNSFISFTTSGTYKFIDKNYSLYGELGVYPWPTWALKVYGTYQYYYDEDKYLDYKISLGKSIGFTEIRLVWSYSRERIDLEIGNATF